MKHIFALATVIPLWGCGGDSFQFFYIEGGPDVEQDSSSDSSTVPESSNDSPMDPLDSALNSPNDSGDASCNQTGSTACTAVIDAYCTRLAACCNQQCSYSWANQGGMACRAYWEANVSEMDCSKYGQEKVCTEGACKTDIGNVSCAAIVCNNQMPCPPLPKPMNITNACSSFWGSL